jgi:hypothetical protein
VSESSIKRIHDDSQICMSRNQNTPRQASLMKCLCEQAETVSVGKTVCHKTQIKRAPETQFDSLGFTESHVDLKRKVGHQIGQLPHRTSVTVYD